MISRKTYTSSFILTTFSLLGSWGGCTALDGSPAHHRALFEHLWVWYVAQGCFSSALAPSPASRTPSTFVCTRAWNENPPLPSPVPPPQSVFVQAVITLSSVSLLSCHMWNKKQPCLPFVVSWHDPQQWRARALSSALCIHGRVNDNVVYHLSWIAMLRCQRSTCVSFFNNPPPPPSWGGFLLLYFF